MLHVFFISECRECTLGIAGGVWIATGEGREDLEIENVCFVLLEMFWVLKKRIYFGNSNLGNSFHCDS